MDMAGEDWEIRRNGEVVSTVQGIRDKKKNKVDFLPGTDVQEGDEVCGAISKQTFRISRTDTNIAHGEVFAVEAYFNERTKAAASGATSHAIHIQNMNNSVIQQNSPGAKASIRVIGAAEKQSVSTILEKVLSLLGSLNLSDDDKEEITGDIGAAQTELTRKTPKAGIISTCLNSILVKLTAAASYPLAHEVAQGVQWAINQIQSLLGTM